MTNQPAARPRLVLARDGPVLALRLAGPRGGSKDARGSAGTPALALRILLWRGKRARFVLRGGVLRADIGRRLQRGKGGAWPGCQTDRSARLVPPADRSRRAHTDSHRDHGRRR